ncbi:MAG TPA: hypothetical protein DC024_10590 [Clostridiales bacterium]|jgi:alpha-L-fucosidase|nr:hypothetical protein [Clostridiales bacterium]HBK42425.1 hypothetical protein [Porphyromonadaceae bacterium]
MKKLFFLTILFFPTLFMFAQQPVEQPDADGRVIIGRAGTHHWRPYMANADLSDYHHASEEVLEQFRDMKYGLRIHWGIYSIVQGRESWVIKENEENSLSYQGFYHDLYKGWYPEAFDADKWTNMMVDNGFKFFTFTTKHHDGFSMYDTKTVIKNRFVFNGENAGVIEPANIHYSIMETPFGRDITGELVKSAKPKGLKIELYYSHPDWYDADFRFDEWNPQLDKNFSPEKNPEEWERFTKRHKEQVRELLTNYGKIDMISFDMWLPEFAWGHMQEMVRMARELQPDCMLRWRGIGNYGDYHTPENYIPGDESQGTMAWQVIHCLSTRNYFGYEPNPQYLRGGDWIVSKLIDIVSKGGNLMVGVGPDLAGNWHPKALESLEYAGKWLKVNGEAIYGTRPCKITKEGSVFYTRNKDNTTTYALIDGWPGKSLFVDHIQPDRQSKIFLLGYNKPLTWKKNKTGILIELPMELQSEENRPCKQAYAFKITGSQK